MNLISITTVHGDASFKIGNKMFCKYRRYLIVFLAWLLNSCTANGVAINEGIAVYKATISQIAGSHINVSGEILVFVPPEDRFFGSIGYGGYLSNVQANLDGSNCPSRDGCGVRIHSGTSCDDSETQGGHFFNFEAEDDPWLDEKYSSDSSGRAVFSSLISIGTDEVNGLPVVVYDELGFRIGCGMLEEVDPFELFVSDIQPMFGSGIHGQVLMYQKAIESSTQKFPICYYGMGSGLEPDVNCEENNFLDACGTHVHAGTSCNTFIDQGQAFFNSMVVNFNPWKELRFLKTDQVGNTQFMHCVHTGEANYEKKVFILHNIDGSRAACGQLHNVATRQRAKRRYVSWILIGFLLPGVLLPFCIKLENKCCNCMKRRK